MTRNERRELFTAHALTALLSSYARPDVQPYYERDAALVSRAAVALATALVDELERVEAEEAKAEEGAPL